MKHIKFFILGSTFFSVLWAATGFFWPTPANAFEFWHCDGEPWTWRSDPDRLRASEVSFPEGSRYRTALGEVVERFNQNPSNFRFEVEYDERVVRMGYQSEIWFSSDPEELHGDLDAVTWVDFTCPSINRFDIVFNANVNWTSGTNKSTMTEYGGNAQSFRTALMHELGHAMGLNHEGDEYNIMGNPRTHLHANCGTVLAYLGEDASDGAVHLYGENPSAGEDVAVVHWKWEREVEWEYGAYSEHTRTGIYPPNSDRLNPWRITENGEPTYIVLNGLTLDFEVTFENNGRTTQPIVPVGIYLSRDDCIDPEDDRRLGEFNISNLARNQVYTRKHTITLPNNLERYQYYYIGVVIDPNNALEEFDEMNNATYVSKIWIWM